MVDFDPDAPPRPARPPAEPVEAKPESFLKKNRAVLIAAALILFAALAAIASV
jgi:hypothetical protein